MEGVSSELDFSKPSNRIKRKASFDRLERLQKHKVISVMANPENTARKIKVYTGVDVVVDGYLLRLK